MEKFVPVEAIMSTFPLSIMPDTQLDKINAIFEHHLFHHLPVVNELNILQGIISKEDLLRLTAVRHHFSEEAYKSITAHDIMTSKVFTIGPRESIEQAANIFLDQYFHALPVVDHGRLVGIVTTYDLLKFQFRPNAYSTKNGLGFYDQ
ncbi:MAG TPA: CBS domain-containing protein [Saprospiraceae bacterium]|nr:CBS domain-containing protein [Saprospiraceae bacterium]MCB9271620.1 CBS domain-containing protein [Lewinellaceae bacterium]HPG09173.1 CBS domain-containing protein [Saprospiraceae bacterium]HPQ99781.1 CBS domain-containing protein [Saprospiraceae bacterium]HQU52774.1 CBS domain-containing protein [Saprospiraceae bacterium]